MLLKKQERSNHEGALLFVWTFPVNEYLTFHLLDILGFVLNYSCFKFFFELSEFLTFFQFPIIVFNFMDPQ